MSLFPSTVEPDDSRGIFAKFRQISTTGERELQQAVNTKGHGANTKRKKGIDEVADGQEGRSTRCLATWGWSEIAPGAYKSCICKNVLHQIFPYFS